MVNLIEFALKSDGGERLLFISPVLLQSKEPPSLPLPLKAYLYENLIKEDWLACYGHERTTDLSEEFKKPKLVIKHDQDFEKPYLGYLTLYPDKNNQWQWEGNSTCFSKHDIEKLESFLNNYRDNKK